MNEQACDGLADDKADATPNNGKERTAARTIVVPPPLLPLSVNYAECSTSSINERLSD